MTFTPGCHVVASFPFPHTFRVPGNNASRHPPRCRVWTKKGKDYSKVHVANTHRSSIPAHCIPGASVFDSST